MYSKPIHGIRNLIGVIQIGFDYSTELTEEWYGYFEILMSQAALGFDKIQLLDNLRLRNIELEEAYDSAIKGWANALELRDKETKGHSDRVVKLAEEYRKTNGLFWHGARKNPDRIADARYRQNGSTRSYPAKTRSAG